MSVTKQQVLDNLDQVKKYVQEAERGRVCNTYSILGNEQIRCIENNYYEPNNDKD